MTNPGKVVLITGGSRGIGYATARAFLVSGARVAIIAQDPARLDAAAAQLRSLGEVRAHPADVAGRPMCGPQWPRCSLIMGPSTCS